MKPIQLCEAAAVVCACTLFVATSSVEDYPENVNEILDHHLQKNDGVSERDSVNEEGTMPAELVEVG